MEDINLFLAHAVELEREAARRYEELAESMKALGSEEVAKFFSQMASFSRMHLEQAMARGGFHQLPVLKPEEYQWPEGSSPEQFGWAGVDAMIDVKGALLLALEGETRSRDFYSAISDETHDPEVKAMAKEFAEEESGHVLQLEKWMARQA